jgi:hypothetical protein
VEEQAQHAEFANIENDDSIVQYVYIDAGDDRDEDLDNTMMYIFLT